MSIEAKWQKLWAENNVYETDILFFKKNPNKQKYYALDMFPYPSGSGLHVGHIKGYTATDIVARYKKQKGFEVLHPMGFDAFGLPAEQYAIQTGNSPATFTDENIKHFKTQLNSFAFSYDWDREVVTSKPWYYKHTQWIFTKFLNSSEKLAEYKNIEVNWSPSLNTVLANEEVLDVDGKKVSERDGKIVEKKQMQQWVLLIQKYSDELYKDLDKLDWPRSVKSLQKNWIYNHDEKGVRQDLHLRDWVFSRQRYWGEPFPVIHTKEGKIIPETNLPLELPTISDYRFSEDGKPALAKAESWINISNGTRDLNTMPQWAGSCWYYMAYLLKEKNTNSIHQLDSQEAKEILDKWLPVDLYIGGQEHAVLHLLYARFWHKFLVKEVKLTKHNEPFQRLFNQGMILGPDGTKMSKSKGNVISPQEVISKYGLDSIRLYEMFMGPLEQDKSWSDEQIKASKAWLDRVERLIVKKEWKEECSDENKLAFNTMVKNIEGHIEELRFNNYVSEMMIFINALYKDANYNKEMIEGFVKILSYICPYTAEELWQTVLGNTNKFIYKETFPSLYNVKEKEQTLFLMIQVNGKLRGKYVVPNNIVLEKSWEELSNLPFPTNNNNFNTLVNLIVTSHEFSKFITNEIVKVIYIDKKILSIITK